MRRTGGGSAVSGDQMTAAEHAATDHEAITGVLSAAEHAAIDHEAITGVLSATEHAAIDHEAVTGVLSATEHGAIDHSGLASVMSPGEHATTDHTGLPGISGGGLAGYYPDTPPTSPHANDDEFSDQALAAAWTEWDPASLVLVTEDSFGRLQVTNQNTAANNRWGGVRRAKPSGDFQVVTKVSVTGKAAGNVCAGLFIAADLAANPTTADFVVVGIGTRSGAPKLFVEQWNNYDDAAVAGAWASQDYSGTHAYLRVRHRASDTATCWDVSTDGSGWRQLYVVGSLPFTAAHIGLCAQNNGTSEYIHGLYQFWRQVDSFNATQILLGQVVS